MKKKEENKGAILENKGDTVIETVEGLTIPEETTEPGETPGGKEETGKQETGTTEDETQTAVTPAIGIGRVIGGNLNVRQRPDIESPIVGRLENGSERAILENLGGWYKIPTGYVMAKYIEVTPVS